MSDYNDGKWHGWNGGKCPVHLESIVEIATSGTRGGVCQDRAGTFIWSGSDYLGNPIVAFRVVKEHREPREFWVKVYAVGGLKECASFAPGAFKVREVIEE